MKNLSQLLLAPALLLTTVAYSAEPAAQTDLIARGTYLVNGIAGCADCHSPRNQKGEFVMEKWLGGAPLGFAPTVPMPAWAPAAPAIAGLPGFKEEQIVVFLQTGKRADGSMPRPPMPPYRFNEADARAVVAYLKSLGQH